MPVKADIESKEKGQQPNPVVPDIIQEAAAITSLVTTSQQSAILSNLAMSNSVLQTNLAQQSVIGNQRSLGKLQIISAAKSARMVNGLEVAESKASSEYLTSDATSEQIADLKATIESLSGGVKPVKPVSSVFLPANGNQGSNEKPYQAVAPTQLVLLNVANPEDLIVEKTVGETETIVRLSADESNITPLPPLPRMRIPVPIPANTLAYAHVPLVLAYSNDHQTRTIQVGDVTAENVIRISEKSS